MIGEYYVINYYAMDQLYANISNRIEEWNTQLGEWTTSYQKLVDLESFQGTSAECAKTYLQEVHGILLYSIQQALVAYQANFLLYKNGYYSIEPNIYSNIPQQAVQNIVNKMQTENTELDTISDNIQAALSSVSDIYPLANPTCYNLYSTMNGIQNTLRLRDQKIDSYEDSQYTDAYDNVQKLLDSLQRTIEDYLENGTNVASYSTGDMAYNLNVQDLYQKVEVSSANIDSKQIEIEAAANQQMEVYAQMQADYEAACEARKDEGTAKMIMGGFAVALGIIAIVGTAGMATPVVVVAGISGTCTMAYGMSNMTEGAQDYYYGSIGDLSTEAINPIRDTYFCGNQELYDAWGSLNMTIAGLCIPVGTATTGVTGMGNVAKVGMKTVGKEMLKDKVYDEVSEAATNCLTEKFHLNMTQSTLINLGFNMGMDKTGDAIGGKLSGLKNTAETTTLAKDMDVTEAARYDAYWNNLESGKASPYPGLSEADVAAWDFANSKLNEHITIKDVDTDAVVKLRADEMAKQDAFLNGASGNVENVVISELDTSTKTDTANDSAVAEDMFPDEFARYEAHLADMAAGKVSQYPGLSEADIAAWDFANGKLNEHIAIKDVDTDTVVKLRADEMTKQDAFLNGEKITAEGGGDVIKNNLVNKVKDIRAKMPNTNLSKRGNMAVADVDVPGIKDNFVAHSKINAELDKGADVADFSYLKPENERIFTSYVDDQYPRYHDTEAKILEDIASQITDPNVSGTINLYSELPCCQSCSNVILEFRRMFPNIELNIFVE